MQTDWHIETIGYRHILRDDILSGGTKRRGLSRMIAVMKGDEFFYAGTTMGHGALALAHACANNRRQAHVFISGVAGDPMISRIEETSAVVYLRPPMPVADLHREVVEQAKGRPVFPPGFDTPDFTASLSEVVSQLDVSPYSEIWTVSVTGTLTRALKQAFPGTLFRTVSVVKSGAGDFQAPEKYHQPARRPPPYPSCPYTDAKIWQFAESHAAPNALIWNTAG